MASISLRNIKKTYGNKVTVIENLNLEIEDREFIVLVGPSGCGKSTTLRMIAGLESVTDGDLLIGERRVNDVAPKDRDIAMVFQNYALYPHMTVYRNMAYALELRRVPKDKIREKVEEVAGILELTQYLDRKPKELSGGQRQRVALGRAMVRDPAVFLLDEPLSNLDAKLRTEMRAQISALHKSLQTTFVYVTHDQTEAMTMGDRIVVMKDGRIYQVDTPQTLYNRPDNIFVAGFIGSPQMNFLNGTVERLGDAFEVVCGELHTPLANPALADFVGKPVVLGVRPEDINEWSPDLTSVPGALMRAEVSLAELMGNEVYVYFDVGEERLIARISSRLDIRAGDRLDLVPDLSKVHVFDQESGKAICHGSNV